MELAISKWGNSLGIRLPKAAVNSLRLSEGDKLEYVVSDTAMTLTKAKSTRSLFEEYYHKPYDEISVSGNKEEIDWGEDVGKEVIE